MDGICKMCGDLGVQADPTTGLCSECETQQFIDVLNSAQQAEIEQNEQADRRVEARKALLQDVAKAAEERVLQEPTFKNPPIRRPQPPGS